MNLNLSILYYHKKAARYVCFKHAVQLAAKGIDIEPEIDEDGGSEYDMRDLSCFTCETEPLLPEDIDDGRSRKIADTRIVARKTRKYKKPRKS